MSTVRSDAVPGKVRKGGRRPNGCYPAPFLKWAGGKGQLLEAILSRLPNPVKGTYVEPFLGGAAVFFELARLGRIERARLSDGNPELVDTYRAVRDDVEGVIRALAAHKNDETYYYEVREIDRSTLSLAERAARTIFLNRVGYNGLYRVNSKGGFNVPFGRYENPKICDEEGLRAASRALALATIEVQDFDAACKDVAIGDVVYLDPPYVPLSKTASFTSYARDKFGPDEHERLAVTFARLVDVGAFVLLSNSDTDVTRALYAGFKITSVDATRNINSKGDRRGAVKEILVSGIRPAPKASVPSAPKRRRHA